MTQELIDLRASIIEGRYEDALNIVDELDWMSKKATLRNIKSYLVRMLIHLIKNQVEQWLNNSWAASIEGSILEIQDLNLKDNKTSHYINQNEWESYLEDAFEAAISPASLEVANGVYKSYQLEKLIDKAQIMNIAKQLLDLTYTIERNKLREAVYKQFNQLPGGEEWNFEREN